MLVYFSGDWEVHWGYGVLTHSQTWLSYGARRAGRGDRKGLSSAAARVSGCLPKAQRKSTLLEPLNCAGNHPGELF